MRTITFVHLSDIHFSKRSGDHYDLDYELRSELERDVAAQITKMHHPVTGVLVTGDIAYSGHVDEYRTAREWLEKLCTILSIDKANVWLIPGNHDVDRRVVNGSRSLSALYQLVEKASETDVARITQGLCRNSVDANCLFSPLTAYNKFSEPFGCEISPQRPYWNIIELLDGDITISIWGLNSVIMSGPDDRREDCHGTGSLVLGSFQIPPPMENTIHMTLCHHPPAWLKDKSEIEPRLNDRVMIQLFGHEHDQQIAVNDKTLRLVAGAVHPTRGTSDGMPVYNIISLHINLGPPKALVASVSPRMWDHRDLRFTGRRAQEVRFPIRDEEQYGTEGDDLELVTSMPAPDNSGFAVVSETINAGRMSVRSIAFRFIDLPYQLKIEIAQELDLLQDSDEYLMDRERFRLVLRRVREANLWPELLERIEIAENAGERQ